MDFPTANWAAFDSEYEEKLTCVLACGFYKEDFQFATRWQNQENENKTFLKKFHGSVQLILVS